MVLTRLIQHFPNFSLIFAHYFISPSYTPRYLYTLDIQMEKVTGTKRVTDNFVILTN